MADLGPDRRRRGARSGRQRLHQRPAWTAARTVCGVLLHAGQPRDAGRRQDHRRAHQHQSQQGRAHRPPAQRRPGRHVRPHAARAAATTSKCRTTSTTPACRWPTWWSASTTSRKMSYADVVELHRDTDVRFDYYCWDLYARGLALQDHPEAAGMAPADAARHRDRRRANWSHLARMVGDAIVEATSTPCCGWTSSTTCCRARARSCT